MEQFESTGSYTASKIGTPLGLELPQAGSEIMDDAHQQLLQPEDPGIAAEHTRTGTSVETLKAAFQDNLNDLVGRPLHLAAPEQRYEALAQTCTRPHYATMGHADEFLGSAHDAKRRLPLFRLIN